MKAGGKIGSNLSWIPYHEGLRAHHPLHVYYYHHHHVPHVLVLPLFFQHLQPLFHCEPCSVRVAPSPPVMRYWGSPRLYVEMPAAGTGSSSMMTSAGLSDSLSSSCISPSLSFMMGCCCCFGSTDIFSNRFFYRYGSI
jgi:hypothetical protein